MSSDDYDWQSDTYDYEWSIDWLSKHRARVVWEGATCRVYVPEYSINIARDTFQQAVDDAEDAVEMIDIEEEQTNSGVMK